MFSFTGGYISRYRIALIISGLVSRVKHKAIIGHNVIVLTYNGENDAKITAGKL